MIQKMGKNAVLFTQMLIVTKEENRIKSLENLETH